MSDSEATKVENGSAHHEELTEEQQTALEQFRQNVQEILKPCHDDYYLLRWLRAKKFDPQRAERKLREHFKFRKNMGLDMKLSDYKPPEVFEKYASWFIIGPDKEDDVVIATLTGQCDAKGYVHSMTFFDQIKTVCYCVEKALSVMQEWNKKDNKNGRRIVYITDLEGLDLMSFMDKAVLKYNIDLSRMYEANYPELLKKMYVLNVPSYFYTWYNMMKGFIDPNTEQKIQLFQRDEWKEELVKIVDADILPTYFGGNRPDPDGPTNYGNLFVHERKIPISYYLTASNTDGPMEQGTTGLCIRERSFYNHHIEVREVNSRIEWYFQTVGYNIKFGVYFAREGVAHKAANKQQGRAAKKDLKSNDYEQLLPIELVESHVIPERGELICQRCGTYILHFDNSFSVLTPKQLYYKAEVLPPLKSFVYPDENNGKCYMETNI